MLFVEELPITVLTEPDVQQLCGCYDHITTKPSKKGKVLPYLSPNVGPGADPGVQAVSLQVTF